MYRTHDLANGKYNNLLNEVIKPQSDPVQRQLSQALDAQTDKDLIKLVKGFVELRKVGSFVDDNIEITARTILAVRRIKIS
jgi:hypothetical protein